MRQAPLGFSSGAFITAVALIVLFVAIGTFVAGTMLRAAGRPVSAAAMRQALGPAPERPRMIEGVYQTLIETDETTADERRRALQQLSTYGWVDERNGVVRIPIARAMALVAQEEGQ